MNVMTVSLVALWLLLDVLFAVLARRSGSPVPAIALWATQVLVAGTAAMALLAGEPIGSAALWLMLSVVNISLAIVGLNRQVVLAVVGVVGTLVAIALILLHSFLSLPLMAVAAVFCLGSALSPGRRMLTA